MRVHFIGGAQMAKYQAMLRRSLPTSVSRFSEHSPRLADFEAAGLSGALERADIVVIELSALGDPALRRKTLAGLTEAEIIAMPELRLDGIASLELETSPEDGTVIHGLDALLGEGAEQDRAELMQRFVRGEIDMQQGARLSASLDALRALEDAHCDVRVSGVIAENLREIPVVYGIASPTQSVLFRAFERLCDYLGIDPDPTMSWDRVFAASLALPMGLRSFTPWDVKAHALPYEPDTHWYPQAQKLVNRAWQLSRQAGMSERAGESPMALRA